MTALIKPAIRSFYKNTISNNSFTKTYDIKEHKTLPIIDLNKFISHKKCDY